MKQLDALFINPGNAQNLYQELSKKYAAIEPNIWAGMLANSCLSIGLSAEILDANLYRFSPQDVADKIKEYNPKTVIFVVTGQNPNASTCSMSGAVAEADMIQCLHPEIFIVFVGPHVNALPIETLEKHPFIDICCTNEGVYSIRNLLSCDLSKDLSKIKGIAYRDRTDGKIYLNDAEMIVPQDKLEQDLPGIAWHLLPSLDQYRTGIWHCEWNPNLVSPFASLYTSLGCPMRCDFCMINIINRTDNDNTLSAKNFNTWRSWSPEFIIKQFDYLAEHNVKQIKIADEMWVYKPQHFMRICDLIIERRYDFNIWGYARVDMTQPKYLETMRKAGVRMLGIGIESGNKDIRSSVDKGKFNQDTIHNIVRLMKDNDINPGGNYLFGLPNDTIETMQETLDLALELLCENSNFYATVALPGSNLYLQAKKDGIKLPNKYEDYSFYAKDHIPLPTKYLTSAEVLQFRDEAFMKYFTNHSFLELIRNKFGQIALNSIQEMTKITLTRTIY